MIFLRRLALVSFVCCYDGGRVVVVSMIHKHKYGRTSASHKLHVVVVAVEDALDRSCSTNRSEQFPNERVHDQRSICPNILHSF